MTDFMKDLLSGVTPQPVSCWLVNITPEMAEEWLKHNMLNNRMLKKTVVTKYTNDIMSDNWTINTDCIAFNENGELINGQHRLNAIVKSGLTVRCLVWFGAPINEKAVRNIDRPSVRTINDAMQISGINDDIYMRAQSTVCRYIKFESLNDSRVSTVSDVVDFITTNIETVRTMLSITKMTKSGGSRIQAGVSAAVLAAIANGVNVAALESFCNVYRNQDVSGCEEFNPQVALKLRDEIRAAGISGTSQYANAKRHIHAFVTGAKRVSSTWGNVYPIKLNIR